MVVSSIRVDEGLLDVVDEGLLDEDRWLFHLLHKRCYRGTRPPLGSEKCPRRRVRRYGVCFGGRGFGKAD
jgi:hypothetical protein